MRYLEKASGILSERESVREKSIIQEMNIWSARPTLGAEKIIYKYLLDLVSDSINEKCRHIDFQCYHHSVSNVISLTQIIERITRIAVIMSKLHEVKNGTINVVKSSCNH